MNEFLQTASKLQGGKAEKPWRSLGESNPSFQIEKLTKSVDSIGLFCKPRPFCHMNFCGRPGEVQTGLCPACGASGYRVRARLPGEKEPFRVRFRCCWMCAGKLTFREPRPMEGGGE